jgi:hypothetical protein
MCSSCGVNKCSCNKVACSPCNGQLTNFDCVEYTGSNKTCIGLDKYDKLSDLTTALDEVICTLQTDSGKVFVSDTGTTKKTLKNLLSAGANIAITEVGTGAAKTLRIDSVTGGTVQDVSVKISATDTTASYLNSKLDVGSYLNKTITSPAGNEKLLLDVDTAALLSTDPANKLSLAFDQGLFFDGISRIDPAYNDTWNTLTITGSTPSGVTLVLNSAKYRVRFDGTVEFKGYIDFTCDFTKYTSANTTWQYSFVLTSLSTVLSGIFTSGEIGNASGQNRSIANETIIEAPASLISPDTFPKITQMKGYNIEWSTTNLTARLYGIYEANTPTKAVRVSFEGASLFPNI